ncbi:glutathione S-transferase Mu 1 [Galendromus occidentalis]|uniref:glutathione transferase n=1 Tax=Galendromus occidentalis TaxID=34638 RepID=A0AAJ7L744_9ACAR|nr:glutathione S-transferase Mu 1 [Galendromus occidentalis]
MASADDSVAQFGYWNIRGLGQSIRHVLNYCEVQYDERTYDFGEKNDTRENWLKEKFTLGLDFPNLPYLKMGEVKLTQSLAILRYLARRGGLFPQTEEGQQRVDVIEQQTNDIIWDCVRLCYGESYSDKEKEEYMKQFQELRCEQLEKFLGDRNYIAGEQLTYVDFLLWETLDQHRTLWPEYEKMYSKHPKLESYLKRIEGLPKVAKFLESEKCIKWPVWSERSLYGGPKMAAPRSPVKY